MALTDEQYAFRRWRSDPDKWISSSIYAYYDVTFKASQRAVAQGRRSETFGRRRIEVGRTYLNRDIIPIVLLILSEI